MVVGIVFIIGAWFFLITLTNYLEHRSWIEAEEEKDES